MFCRRLIFTGLILVGDPTRDRQNPSLLKKQRQNQEELLKKLIMMLLRVAAIAGIVEIVIDQRIERVAGKQAQGQYQFVINFLTRFF